MENGSILPKNWSQFSSTFQFNPLLHLITQNDGGILPCSNQLKSDVDCSDLGAKYIEIDVIDYFIHPKEFQFIEKLKLN